MSGVPLTVVISYYSDGQCVYESPRTRTWEKLVEYVDNYYNTAGESPRQVKRCVVNFDPREINLFFGEVAADCHAKYRDVRITLKPLGVVDATHRATLADRLVWLKRNAPKQDRI